MTPYKRILISAAVLFFSLGFLYSFHSFFIAYFHKYFNPSYDFAITTVFIGLLLFIIFSYLYLRPSQDQQVENFKKEAVFNRKISDLIPNMIFILNIPKGKFTYVNNAFLDTVGYSFKEIHEMDTDFINRIIHPQDTNKSFRNEDYLKNFSENKIVKDEIRLIHKNGTEIFIKRTTYVFNKDENNHIIEVMGFGTDITEEKKLQIERMNLRDELANEKMISIHSAKMAALGEMSAGIAHEVNTPLGIIKLKADLLKESVEENNLDSKLFIKISDDISETVSRIAKIVKSLRFFSRDGSDDPFQLISTHSLVEETLGLCKEKFNSQGVQLKLKMPEIDLKIECRPSDLSQVLLNLVGNSLDAIQNQKEKWIYIEIAEQGLDLEISITDSGNGIPQEIQDKMMNPFFTTKEFGSGSGLGLSISRGVILAHNGRLEFDIQSKNTRFVIRLPRAQNIELKAV